MACDTEMGTWVIEAESQTTRTDQGIPGHTFCTKHLSTVRAEEVLWVPGLVHCRQHSLEKEHTERYQNASEL